MKKTGRIIIASDACQRGSIINDFAENISQMAFDYLDAPPVVLGARNWITPVYELEKDFFPQAEWFLDAYHQRICPLPDYTPARAFNPEEDLRSAAAESEAPLLPDLGAFADGRLIKMEAAENGKGHMLSFTGGWQDVKYVVKDMLSCSRIAMIWLRIKKPRSCINSADAV